MASDTWFGRIRALDVRILAAVVATLLLVFGVMWVVPTTPTSNSFTFDKARRGINDALPIEFDQPVEGMIVDGSDADFYRTPPLKSSYRVDVQLKIGSAKMIPGLRLFDSSQRLFQDHTAQYVRNPGADINTSFIADSNATYYVQVLSQRNTSGPYVLTISLRKP